MVKETHEMINQTIQEGVKARVGNWRGPREEDTSGKLSNSNIFPFLRQVSGWEFLSPSMLPLGPTSPIWDLLPTGQPSEKGASRTSVPLPPWSRRLEKGVFINLGSAVILPEVFLKALALRETSAIPFRISRRSTWISSSTIGLP